MSTAGKEKNIGNLSWDDSSMNGMRKGRKVERTMGGILISLVGAEGGERACRGELASNKEEGRRVQQRMTTTSY